MTVHYPAVPRAELGRASWKAHMEPTYNGMPCGLLPDLAWHKSQRSNPSGNCVELAVLPARVGVAIRNSRDPDGPALVYTLDEIAAFLDGVRDGDFDHLLT
jgi:Domain of unknown function (DUF397)